MYGDKMGDSSEVKLRAIEKKYIQYWFWNFTHFFSQEAIRLIFLLLFTMLEAHFFLFCFIFFNEHFLAPSCFFPYQADASCRSGTCQ